MSIHDSYSLSPEDYRQQRVDDIDAQERALLECIRALQGERAIILKTLGVTALRPFPNASTAPVLGETA